MQGTVAVVTRPTAQRTGRTCLAHREEVCFILRGDRGADSVDGRQKMVGTKALRLAARFVLLSVEPFDNTILAQMHVAVNDKFSGDFPQVEECSDL